MRGSPGYRSGQGGDCVSRAKVGRRWPGPLWLLSGHGRAPRSSLLKSLVLPRTSIPGPKMTDCWASAAILAPATHRHGRDACWDQESSAHGRWPPEVPSSQAQDPMVSCSVIQGNPLIPSLVATRGAPRITSRHLYLTPTSSLGSWGTGQPQFPSPISMSSQE
jgi:hypothetical protein